MRVALGASRPRILSMILGDVGRIMAIGVVAGGVLALAAGRGIGSLLFGLSADDMTTLVIAAACCDRRLPVGGMAGTARRRPRSGQRAPRELSGLAL